MNADDFILDQKTVVETRYLVKVDFEDRPPKRKWFNRKHYILGWVAKQYMLPIFDYYHAKYGCQRGAEPDENCVWDEWGDRKVFFVKTLTEKGLEKAFEELHDYLSEWF